MQDTATIMVCVSYYICSFLWGIFSILWKKEVCPESSAFRLICTGYLNQFFFPIYLILAIKRFKSDLNIIKRREYEKNNSTITTKFIFS